MTSTTMPSSIVFNSLRNPHQLLVLVVDESADEVRDAVRSHSPGPISLKVKGEAVYVMPASIAYWQEGSQRRASAGSY